jgi:hypothetical protein
MTPHHSRRTASEHATVRMTEFIAPSVAPCAKNAQGAYKMASGANGASGGITMVGSRMFRGRTHSTNGHFSQLMRGSTN